MAEHPVEPDQGLAQQPAGEPEIGEPDQELDGGVEVTSGEGPLEGAPEVVMLRFLAGGELVVGEEPAVRFRGQPQLDGEMPVACRLGLTRRLEPGECELTDRFQEPVAGLGAVVVGHHQRLVDQAGQQIQHLQGFDPVP